MRSRTKTAQVNALLLKFVFGAPQTMRLKRLNASIRTSMDFPSTLNVFETLMFSLMFQGRRTSGFRRGALPSESVALLAELAGSGRVLELGIGTGRLALPLRERGVEIEGIDASPAMVDRLLSKPGGREIPVTVGNFADLEVHGKFSLIFVAFNTFFALPSQEDQLRCFGAVSMHLGPGGAFLIEAFVPDLSQFDRGQRLHAMDVEMALVTVRRFHDVVARDCPNSCDPACHLVFVPGPYVSAAWEKVRQGGFKLKVLEYVFNRIPVFALTGSFAGVPLKHEESVMLFPDHTSLAQGVLEAIDDVERLNRLQERAYAACSDRFDWASRGRQILSAIARPLGATT